MEYLQYTLGFVIISNIWFAVGNFTAGIICAILAVLFFMAHHSSK